MRWSSGSQSFVTPEATKLLREHDIATVLADTAGKWPKVDEDTSDFRYVRLHGDAELYASGYSAPRSTSGPRLAAAGPPTGGRLRLLRQRHQGLRAA